MQAGTGRQAMSPRDVACRHLVDLVRSHPELYPRPVPTDGLDDRDRRLAEAIVHTATRRWETIRAIADHALTSPWERLERPVKAALLSGCTQLLFLDRVPDHAVVGETVEWTKRSTKRRGASGLVNAVLRRITALRGEALEQADGRQRDHILLSHGGGWQTTEPVFAEDELLRASQQTGHAPLLVERWSRAMGPNRAIEIALHGLCDPPIIIHGAGPDECLLPHDVPGFHVLAPGCSLQDVLERHEEAIVQDPATAEAVRLTASLSPGTILDMCAGRGTKTRQLAAQHPGSRIIASDADPGRLEDLRKLADMNSNIEVLDLEEVRMLRNVADLLVLDVPCSNTGVLARRSEARIRFSQENLDELVSMQRQITADSILTLADDAHILYATCSLEQEENEEMPTWLKRWHGFELVQESRFLPAGHPGGPSNAYRDGGYAALVRK